MKRVYTFEDIDHGTLTGHGQHRRHEIDYPEDRGGEPCGCRAAWNAYQAGYKGSKGADYKKRNEKARRRALSRLARRFKAEYDTYYEVELQKLEEEGA